MLAALHELKREKVPQLALAEEACHIEIDLAGHAAGKHDHYLAAFGGITCLDIGCDGRVKVTPLNVSLTTIEEFRNNILLFYTGLTRKSDMILEAQKNDTANGDPAVLDSLHRTRELGLRIQETLERGDLEAFGLLLDEQWQNKKRRSTQISDARIDRWYDLAKQKGALGARLLGPEEAVFSCFAVLTGTRHSCAGLLPRRDFARWVMTLTSKVPRCWSTSDPTTLIPVNTLASIL